MPHLTRERIMAQFCDIKRMSNVTVRGRSATAAKNQMQQSFGHEKNSSQRYEIYIDCIAWLNFLGLRTALHFRAFSEYIPLRSN